MSADPRDQVTTAISISNLHCGRYRDVPPILLNQAQQLICSAQLCPYYSAYSSSTYPLTLFHSHIHPFSMCNHLPSYRLIASCRQGDNSRRWIPYCGYYIQQLVMCDHPSPLIPRTRARVRPRIIWNSAKFVRTSSIVGWKQTKWQSPRRHQRTRLSKRYSRIFFLRQRPQTGQTIQLIYLIASRFRWVG
jgi:hypothetical protein